MLKTTKYQMNKPELTDSPPDITVLNGNFDIIDLALFNKVEKIQGKGLSTNDYDNREKSEVAKVKDKQNQIDSTLTTASKVIVGAINELNNNKVTKATGKDLSTNDYTTTEKNKLAGIAAGANAYTHPSSHSASIITQDSTHRFLTDTERALINDFNNFKNNGGTINGDIVSNGLKTDRITGKSSGNFYIGDGSGGCRMECNTLIRLYTSWVGSRDCGLYINPDGSVGIRNNNTVRHLFNADGTKIGGTMEIDGTVYGMSPTDSPQTLIEYIIPDVEVNGEKIIYLDDIYKKMISRYVVFSSNPDIRITEKTEDYFKIEGTGKVDFVIKGQRKGAEEYFRIMGGLEHGVTEEQTI